MIDGEQETECPKQRKPRSFADQSPLRIYCNEVPDNGTRRAPVLARPRRHAHGGRWGVSRTVHVPPIAGRRLVDGSAVGGLGSDLAARSFPGRAVPLRLHGLWALRPQWHPARDTARARSRIAHLRALRPCGPGVGLDVTPIRL